MDLSKIIGKPVHAIHKNSWGVNIISGLIVGIEFTHHKPKYCIGFGNNSVWVDGVAETKEELLELLVVQLKLPTLDKVKEIGTTIKINL